MGDCLCSFLTAARPAESLSTMAGTAAAAAKLIEFLAECPSRAMHLRWIIGATPAAGYRWRDACVRQFSVVFRLPAAGYPRPYLLVYLCSLRPTPCFPHRLEFLTLGSSLCGRPG